MKENEFEAVERRKKTYGCNGLCYGGIDENGEQASFCGGIDTCDETRFMEFIATIFAGLVILLFPILLIAAAIFCFIYLL